MKAVNITMIQKDKKMFSFTRIIRAKFASDNSFTLIEPCLPAGRSSFTLIELLIVTPQRPDRSGQRGKSAMPIGRQASSFTLIELLIVIGILAILVAAIVVVLNPAQLLAQARDGKRQQDLSALNQSLNTIYALDQSVSFGTSSIVYTSLPDTSTSCASWFPSSSLPVGWQYHCSPTTTLQNTDGTGWIPVNFKTTGVVSLSSLPTDPQNTSSTGLYYTYVTGGSFQLASHFESAKYQATQGSDAMYTVGSNLALAPFLSGLVGWWKFDEGSGATIYDSSGYNATGTFYGTSTTRFGVGKIGLYAGSFTQANGDYAQAYESSVRYYDEISFGGWYYTSSTAQMFPITLSSDGICTSNACDDWGIIRAAGSIEYNRYDPVSGASTVSSLPATSIFSGWNQIFFVFKRSNYFKVYLNGNEIASAGNNTSKSFGFNNVAIGSYYPTWGQVQYRFNGLIDDVRIYNRALSAPEIQALYNATR